MWVSVVLPWFVVDNFYFWYLVEVVIVFHNVTDALAEFTDLNADIPQKGAACPSSHDKFFFGYTLAR